MQCHIYRSPRKPNSYLYLPDKNDISALSDEFFKLFGEPEFSFSFELTADREMPQADAAEVIKNIQEKGYYLQISNDDKDPFDALIAAGKLS